MDDEHAKRRDKKLNKRRYGMRISGRSIKSVLLPVIAKKGKKGGEKK